MAFLGARWFWILLVLCGIPLNQIGEPMFIPERPVNAWHLSEERCVSPADSVELFRSWCMYLGPPTLKAIIAQKDSDWAFGAIGEIEGIDLMKARDRAQMHDYAIARLRVIRPLSKGPVELRFLIPNGMYRDEHDVPQCWRTGGFDPAQYVSKGDYVLGVFHRLEGGLPVFRGTWGTLALWHLKDSTEDESQYLYQVETAIVDMGPIQELPPSMNMKDLSCFYLRAMETDGSTLAQGIQAVRFAFAGAESK